MMVIVTNAVIVIFFYKVLRIGYVDYEKAFDSIEHDTFLDSLRSTSITKITSDY